MKSSHSLFFYISKRLFLYFCLTLYACVLLIFFIDLVELFRRADGSEQVGWGLLLGIGLLRLPLLIEQLLPLILLFGVLLTCSQLSRSQEFIAMRSMGMSVWQFLAPTLLFAFFLGVLSVLLYNPLASVLAARAEPLENRHIEQRSSTFAISASGVWLRQADAQGHSVVHSQHAEELADGRLRLSKVNIFLYDANAIFSGRLDAEIATLHDRFWELQNTWELRPETAAIFHNEYRQPTTLTPGQIRESLADPDSISFWELHDFIEHTRAAGLSVTRYQTHYQKLIATPFFLCAMILLAVTFVFRLSLERPSGIAILGATLCGGTLFFFRDFLLQLGASEVIPIALATWASGVIAVCLSGVILLHTEGR
ncbi:MAG: LPS export ABC transporter permease LptG [Hyphomicrobiales bacterium]|nr:LPS export ABC transporter permease LptG [Hyphomicrobiales bacterium]MCY4032423.1 LPS export ABC transporter permease LptG [Hyphomicrobiales bacterium]MCY4038423.1 LPS export ABC transporter permease LptG [Hyphomicrobiales bacterium]